MAFEALRAKLRSLADGDESRRSAGETVRRRAPATGLEGNRKPKAPTQREELAKRLQSSGQMRKPVPDANLEPGANPREIEAFARGDAGVQAGFEGDGGDGGMGAEPRGDPYQSYFASGDDPSGGTSGPFVEELLDERDHEGGLYAYEDEHERGMVDDGVTMDVGVDARF